MRELRRRSGQLQFAASMNTEVSARRRITSASIFILARLVCSNSSLLCGQPTGAVVLHRRASRMNNLAVMAEPEKGPNSLAVVAFVVQQNFIRFRHQHVNFECARHRSDQLRLPVTFKCGPPTKATALATIDDCCLVV